MLYPIWQTGRAVGQAEIRQSGLYWDISASCEMQQTPQRLFAQNPGGAAVRLGIPAPVKNLCKLEKRLPRTSFAFCEDTKLCLGGYGAVICGIHVPNGSIFEVDGRRFLQIPYEVNVPFCLMPWVLFFTVAPKNGKMFWICRLDEKNTPIFG